MFVTLKLSAVDMETSRQLPFKEEKGNHFQVVPPSEGTQVLFLKHPNWDWGQDRIKVRNCALFLSLNYFPNNNNNNDIILRNAHRQISGLINCSFLQQT